MASQDSQPFRWHYGDLDDKNFQLHGRALLLLIILFAICLLLTLLCLYAKWICRYRLLTASANIGPSVLHLPNQAQLPGLDPLTISSLPVQLHQSTDGDSQCCICLSSFQEEEKVKVLPGCHHLFHPECVDLWLRKHSSCPLCRASIHTRKEESAHELV